MSSESEGRSDQPSGDSALPDFNGVMARGPDWTGGKESSNNRASYLTVECHQKVRFNYNIKKEKEENVSFLYISKCFR